MRAHQRNWGTWRLFTGVVLFITGLITVGSLEWENPARLAICLGGIVLCILGGGLMAKTSADDEPPVRVGIEVEEDGSCLGSLQRNNYLLTAYERQSADWKRQLRLSSSIPITPKQEAALVPYLVLEGFVATLWPEMWGRIEEEARWAFRA